MQAIWRLLLDDDFIEVYMDGILIECADGIVRHFSPRLFSYSADYPEKYVSCLIVYCILYDWANHTMNLI